MLNNIVSNRSSSPPASSYTRNGIKIKIFIPDKSQLQRSKTDIVIKEKLLKILHDKV